MIIEPLNEKKPTRPAIAFAVAKVDVGMFRKASVMHGHRVILGDGSSRQINIKMIGPKTHGEPMVVAAWAELDGHNIVLPLSDVPLLEVEYAEGANRKFPLALQVGTETSDFLEALVGAALGPAEQTVPAD